MKPLTIVYTTSRKQPRIDFFFASLARQLRAGDNVEIVVIDIYADQEGRRDSVEKLFRDSFRLQGASSFYGLPHHATPKPTIWQGPHRLTKEDWWAKSNALNTGICLCQTEWIAFVDDRSALGPHWLECVKAAQEGMYAVCGSYEKHAGLIVENGEVKGSAEILGTDTRTPGRYPFDSWYGGSGALPLEWALMVNGFSEKYCDSLGSEDSQFGVTLRNNNLPIFYDSEMRLIEDRTPGQIDGALKRADKNPHLGQQAKSWAIVRAFHGQKTSQNDFDIRNLRDRILLNGESLDSIKPIDSDRDWYDGQLIREME